MIPLNNNEIKLLRYFFSSNGGPLTASEIKHATKMGLFKIRRALDSLERKKLVRSLERSRTKPYILSERGQAFAWLAAIRTKGIVEMYRKGSSV